MPSWTGVPVWFTKASLFQRWPGSVTTLLLRSCWERGLQVYLKAHDPCHAGNALALSIDSHQRHVHAQGPD